MEGFFVLHVRREDILLKQKWCPLRLPWVPVFAKKSWNCYGWRRLATTPLDPICSMLRNDVTNICTTFSLFFARSAHSWFVQSTLDQEGVWGGVHMWRQCSISFFSQTPESTNILDQVLQSANGARSQLSVACRMRVARVPSYASMCVIYIHMQAPALTYGNVPLCHV